MGQFHYRSQEVATNTKRNIRTPSLKIHTDSTTSASTQEIVKIELTPREKQDLFHLSNNGTCITEGKNIEGGKAKLKITQQPSCGNLCDGSSNYKNHPIPLKCGS